jgi:transcriptional accessory protein Tex/SPT6
MLICLYVDVSLSLSLRVCSRRLRQLALEDYARELERQGKWQGLPTLSLIREELLAPYRSLRPAYARLTYE